MSIWEPGSQRDEQFPHRVPHTPAPLTLLRQGVPSYGGGLQDSPKYPQPTHGDDDTSFMAILGQVRDGLPPCPLAEALACCLLSPAQAAPR